MPVAVADNADAMAGGEAVAEDPLEGAPIGMHLDGGLEPRTVRIADVRRPAPDVREHDAVLAVELREQLGAGVGVRADVAAVGEHRVRGTPDLPALVPKEDVVVAAHGRIAGPLVTGEDDEAAVLVHALCRGVDLGPEGVGDLEVVGLVAGDIEEGEIAGEL